ncbi:MAG: hypothetical protein AAF847_05540 [Bacteroidota bacterium]
MNRLQWIVVVSSLLLFVLLYFVFDTKTDEQQQIEETRFQSLQSTDVSILIRDARAALEVEQLNAVRILEQEIEISENDSAKVDAYKELSGLWYRLDNAAIAGHYAEEIAKVEDTEQAWSITGTTYAICVQRADTDKVKQFCTDKAFQAFESATSINPDNVQHKVNLALVYLETQNPMAGIQMLRNLNQQYPRNVLVLMTLGRQAMRTNQLERASERFTKVLEIDSDNKEAACALAEIYSKLQRQLEAKQYINICEQ